MRRFTLFEFCDLSPQQPLGWLGELTPGFLAAAFSLTRWYRVAAAPLAQALRRSGATQVLDLGSGSGGPLPLLQRALRRDHDLRIAVRLSDRVPQPQSWQALASPAGDGASDDLAGISEPVDAAAVPAHLTGFRTLFQSFHHLSPPQAQAVLQDAVAKRVGIALFENTHRRLLPTLPLLFVPFAVLLFTPFVRPLSLRRLLLTYVLPLAPLVVLWDALVSALRSYTPAELAQMTAALSYDGADYEWQQGHAWQGLQCVSWLIGTPKLARPSASPQS